MHRPDVSRKLLTIVAVITFASALLSSGAAWARIGYPNPRDNQAIQPGHQFSFRSEALADGGDPTATQYFLQLRIRLTEVPEEWSEWVTQNSVAGTLAFTKTTDDEEEFTWDSTLTDLSALAAIDDTFPEYLQTGLQINEVYQWRINTTTTEGTEWTFIVPMEQPADGAEEVGTWVKFVWDPHPELQGLYLEYMHLKDASEGGDWWIDQNGNRTNIVKTYDPGAVASDYEAHQRRFWVYDSEYDKLYPNEHQYYWRISYNEISGAASLPLYRTADGEPTTNAEEGVSYYWADGGSNGSLGWGFNTINELDRSSATDVESAIVYWQSQYGTLDRDPAMGDYNFSTVATDLQNIHMTQHWPTIGTILVGSQQAAATYGGNRSANDDQAPYTDAIADRDGWYTIARLAKENSYSFSRVRQDYYEEYVSRGVRTFLQDAANGGDFGGNDDFFHLPNLQYITILGDAKRTAPSFYFYHSASGARNWTATDFYYTTQGDSAAPSEIPKYQVGRIPLREKGHRTTDYDEIEYNPEVLTITKIQDYTTLLNSDAKKNFAYEEWFGRAVTASGLTSYNEWFQFYPAAMQNMLCDRIPIGGGLDRDVFSGMLVRSYNFWGNDEEQLTKANVARHLYNFSDPADVPGFIYLMGIGDMFWGNGGHLGQTTRLTDYDTLTPEDFEDEYEDITDGRRPLLISTASLTNVFDNALFASDGIGYQSIGERACLSPGGPIGIVGFASGLYSSIRTDTKTYPDDSELTVTWTGTGVDQDGGYIYPVIDEGQMTLERDGDMDNGIMGKVEFARCFAEEYAATTQAGIGNVFNHALASYITAHQEELDAGVQTVLTNVMGATLLGDPALILPTRQPWANLTDGSRPEVTDTNPRAGNSVVGYTETTPRYNSQDIPIHVIPRSTPYDSTVGTPPITLDIQTNATTVRARILSPFVQSIVPGAWHDTTDTYWTSSDPEVITTVNAACTFTFDLRRPSTYLVIIQAQNPAWTPGVDSEEWRWLKERWFWIQVVNQFTRDSNVNVLVIDDDQYDRFHLHGQYSIQREDYYITPGVDGLGYTATEDPATFLPIPALPYLNKYVGDTFKYQFWSSNAYHLEHTYGNELLAAQQFYGEITPAALKSFEDTRGNVLYFKGDADIGVTPDGFLFITNDMSYGSSHFLRDYLDNGGLLFVSDQILHTENIVSYLAELENDYLGALTATADTDYTNMDGLQEDTLSTFIQDLNVAGGDGANNASWTGELDANGTEALPIFFWDTASGPGTISSSGASAIQNRLVASGARTIFFPWPFEAIQSMGSLTPDGAGRANVMRQILGWLRNVPKPVPIYPADGADGISRAVVLNWSTVPEGYYYKVYISTDPSDLTEPGAIVLRDFPTYDPAKPGSPLEPLLDPQTRYYWRIDVLNQDLQTVTTGDIWSFTTLGPPVKAVNPDPAMLEEQVPITQRLGWNNLGTVSYYDIYLWTADDVTENGGVQLDPAPGSTAYRLDTEVTTMYYQPETDLLPDMVYYWRVDTYNELSEATSPGLNLGPAKGDVWQFTTITPPPKPTNPVPQNGATNVPTSQILSWGATERTDTYDVYLWTGNPLTPPTNPTVTGLTTPEYIPTNNLLTSTLYFWQVRPVNAAGRQDTVDTWAFTTSSIVSPGRVSNMYPADGDTGVPTDVTFTWTASTATATYRIYIGEGSLPAVPVAIGLTLPEYTPATPLTEGVIYYWRVDSVAADGLTITAGPLVRFVTVGGTVFMQAYDPTPAVGEEIDLAAFGGFTWSAGDTATSFDFYLNNAFYTNIPAGDSQTIDILVDGTAYTWRVDVHYPDGSGDEIVIVGETWSFSTTGTAPAGAGGSSSCFIATSAYEAAYRTAVGLVRTNFTGEYVIPADRVEKLDTLRGMRDTFLNKFNSGREFTAWYYAVGPYAAQAIRHNEPAKAAVRRMLLDPLSRLSEPCGKTED